MSLICEALAGSQLNWHRQEKKNQPICRGLIRSLAAWSQGHWMIWSLFIQNPLILEITEICFTMMARERGNISPDEILYALGWRKEKDRGLTQTGETEKEGEDIIYTYVIPKALDEKSHHVRLEFDACCPQMRQLADILWVRRLFYQHFQRDINISVWQCPIEMKNANKSFYLPVPTVKMNTNSH